MTETLISSETTHIRVDYIESSGEILVPVKHLKALGNVAIDSDNVQ